VRTCVSADISKNILTATEDVTEGRTVDTTVDMAVLAAAVYYLQHFPEQHFAETHKSAAGYI
jgi:hypothetical protein